MPFRPEEIHGASGVRQVVEPIPEGDRRISHYSFRLGFLDRSVPHFNPNLRAAIQTGRFDLHRFSWKEPADRQRLESSLAEPFLLAVYSDAVLGWKVAKWRKRADVVCIRKQPSGKGKSG